MKPRILSILVLALLAFGMLLVLAAVGLAFLPDQFFAPMPALAAEFSQSTPTPNPRIMPSIIDRLAPPPTVYPPTQADLGAQVFYQVCMACHGDHGQGLTDEWRQVLDPPDRNCWQSGCHNPHHPPDGFVFPRQVPAVIGGSALQHFQSAANLHAFIKAQMPYQAPGSLSEAEYWQLTAFLLRANGYTQPYALLDEQSAEGIALNTPPAQPIFNLKQAVILMGAIVGLVLVILILRRFPPHNQ